MVCTWSQVGLHHVLRNCSATLRLSPLNVHEDPEPLSVKTVMDVAENGIVTCLLIDCVHHLEITKNL